MQYRLTKSDKTSTVEVVFFILADKNDSKMIHVHKARYHENRGISFALLQVLTFGGQNHKKISIFGTIK